MTPEANQPSPDFLSLADRAILLRRSALQTRLRLVEQSRELERLAGRLSVARKAAAVSVRKEAVAVSAPVPASLRTETRRHAPSVVYAVLPFLAIGAAAYAAHIKIAPHVRVLEAPPAHAAASFSPGRDALLAVEPPAPSADAEESAEALLLVHDWRPAGAERTVLETLGGELDRPGRPPVWSVERVGTRQYLVRFRDGASEHTFEADLEARSVRPAADADALLAHR